MKPYVASYDREADVLYLVNDPPVPSEGAQSDELGLVLDFDLITGQATGTTVVGFRAHGWNRRVSHLADHVADHLEINRDLVVDLLAAAISSDDVRDIARLESTGVALTTRSARPSVVAVRNA